MSKWIAVDDLKMCINILADKMTDSGATAIKQAVNIADSLPSIDIVRCGECKYWQTDWTSEEGVDNFHFCAMVDGSTFGDWFCADGEREEEPQNHIGEATEMVEPQTEGEE